MGDCDQEILQAFFDLADEMERECGNWQSAPDNPELTSRIMAAAIAMEKEGRD